MTSLEEKVRAYKELRAKVEELEQQRKLLVQEILLEMPQDEKAIRVAEYLVKRTSRLSIMTSLQDARELEAVKMQEVIDKKKIKQLHEIGHPVPGVSELHYITVTIPKVPAPEELAQLQE
jgi:hypothetical protein